MSIVAKQCVAALGFGLCLAGTSSPELQAGKAVELVPYKGQVAGELTCWQVESKQSFLAFRPVPGSTAAARSNYLGSGVQRYDPDLVMVIPTGTGVLAEGITETVAANGDVLNLWFSLDATYMCDEVTEAGVCAELVYVGEYEIRPGGTGRFAYPEGCDSLGAGSIAGTATLVVTDVPPPDGPGLVATLTFNHTFWGTLAKVKSGKPEGDGKEPAKKAKKGE